MIPPTEGIPAWAIAVVTAAMLVIFFVARRMAAKHDAQIRRKTLEQKLAPQLKQLREQIGDRVYHDLAFPDGEAKGKDEILALAVALEPNADLFIDGIIKRADLCAHMDIATRMTRILCFLEQAKGLLGYIEENRKKSPEELRSILEEQFELNAIY